MIFTTFIIFQILMLINITLIGGILPLIERKYLSLIQRRVGPKFVGYKGRLQFIADALKMFLKGQITPRYVNKRLFLLWPLIFLSLIYLLHLNIYWNKDIIFIDIEYNILFISIVNVLLTIVSFFTGFFSKNKYGIVSAVRVALVLSCAEILTTALFLIFILTGHSLSFAFFWKIQEEYPILLIVNILTSIVVLVLLIEVAKSPFDLVEAETELVTGFHTEYGAFFFALFYLGEYLHIFFSAAFIIYLLTGFL